MLDPDDRKKVIAWIREHDSDIADELANALTDREHAVDVARAIAKDEDLRGFFVRVTALMERFAAADEKRILIDQQHAARWQAILGPKGLVASLIALAGALGSVAVHDYMAPDPVVTVAPV